MTAIGVDLGTKNTGIYVLADDQFSGEGCTIVRCGDGETPDTYAERIAHEIRTHLAGHAGRHCIAVDIPLYPPETPIARRPIEAMFQGGQFSTNVKHAGIQPNNPEGLQDAINLGRTLVQHLQDDCQATWSPNPAEVPVDRNVVIEVFPTLALGLLANYEQVVQERRWFSLYSKPFALMRCLKAARDTNALARLFPEAALALVDDTELIQNAWNKDHVAALTSAILGERFLNDDAKVYWCNEGHYVLPPRSMWDDGWNVTLPTEGVREVNW